MPDGQWKKPVCLSILDDRSRLCCHLQWYLEETADSLVHALMQAFHKRALPRALLTDNGAAMLAAETTEGLLRPGIVQHSHIRPSKTVNRNPFGDKSKAGFCPCSKASPRSPSICSTWPRKRGSRRSTTARNTPRSRRPRWSVI